MLIMGFEALDRIADSYTPFLAVVFLVGFSGRAFKCPNEKRFLGRVFIFFVGLLVVSYGIMFIDNVVQVWSSFGLDYSTHAAVSLTLALSICALARQFWKMVIGSFVIYVILMLYQNYHTVGDVVSTISVIGSSAFVLSSILFLQAKDNVSVNSQP